MNYSSYKVRGSYSEINWQELSNVLRDLYDPLSLRTFRGSVSKTVINEYMSAHWNSSESQEGFGNAMVTNAANLWEDFKISFFDKDDKHRFINIDFDCKKKNITIVASIENKKEASGCPNQNQGNMHFF